MLSYLTETEIEQLLGQQVIGHLGCHYRGTTYVVPVNYVYRKGDIYAQSGPGKKLDMMRRNPKVCFQVVDIRMFSHGEAPFFGKLRKSRRLTKKKKLCER